MTSGAGCTLPSILGKTNKFSHARLFPTRTTQLTILFLRELQQIVLVTQATILVDDAHHLKTALSRLGLQFQMRRHGNRNAVERVFREVKRRTSCFNSIDRIAIVVAPVGDLGDSSRLVEVVQQFKCLAGQQFGEVDVGVLADEVLIEFDGASIRRDDSFRRPSRFVLTSPFSTRSPMVQER